MRVALVDIYFSARSGSDLLSAAHMVEVSVREEYFSEAELLHTHILEQYARTSADIYCDTPCGSSLHEIAVRVQLTELKSFNSHNRLLSYGRAVDGDDTAYPSYLVEEIFELFGA